MSILWISQPTYKIKPIEINGFLVYIDASLEQKPKIKNLIYADFMLLW